jgi:hypothetical protein
MVSSLEFVISCRLRRAMRTNRWRDKGWASR